MRRSRAQQIADEKGRYGDHMTSSELARYLGLSDRNFRMRRQLGKIPEPAQRTPNGWGLWSPAQTTALLKKELEK